MLSEDDCCPPDNHLDDLRADHIEDYKQQDREEKRRAWLGAVTPVECYQCGTKDFSAWTLLGTDPTYGADADGRRGMTGREWECRCGNTVLVVG